MSHTNPIGSAGRSSLTSAGSCTWLLGRQRLHREGNWEEQRCPERQAGNHEGRGEPSERHLSDDVPSNNFLPCRASSSPILTQLLHIRACQVPPITSPSPLSQPGLHPSAPLSHSRTPAGQAGPAQLFRGSKAVPVPCSRCALGAFPTCRHTGTVPHRPGKEALGGKSSF